MWETIVGGIAYLCCTICLLLKEFENLNLHNHNVPKWKTIVFNDSGKESTCSAGDTRHSLTPGSRRSPGGRNSKPTQYSCLKSQGQSLVSGTESYMTKNIMDYGM